MKPFILLLFLLATRVGQAQMPQVDYSEPFKEPENLGSKLLLCKNGNTLLFSFRPKSPVTVDVYDPGHKLRCHQDSGSIYTNSSESEYSLRGAFEIGDEAVLFVQIGGSKEIPRLFRIHYSTDSGKLLSLTQTAVIPEALQVDYKAGSRAHMGLGYLVRKDAQSDAYAIAYYMNTTFGEFTAFESENLKGRMQPVVFHYDGNHKEIGRAVVSGRPRRYRGIRFGDLEVFGTSEVWTVSMAYNSSKGERAESSAIMLTRIAGGDTSSIQFAGWKEDRSATFMLSSGRDGKTLGLSAAVLMDTRSKVGMVPKVIRTYGTLMAVLDRSTGTVLHGEDLNYDPATKFRANNYGIQNPFGGLPTDLVVDRDGNWNLLCQDISSSSQDMAMLRYAAGGMPDGGFCVRRGNMTTGGMGIMAKAERGHLAPVTGYGFNVADEGYFAHGYAMNSKQQFIFFNEHPGNFGAERAKSQKYLIGISDAQTACYRIAGAAASKFYLFGQPDKNFDNRFADFYSGAYNQDRDKYAVLIVEKSGRKKVGRIAWVRF